MDFNWTDLERSVLDQRFFLKEHLGTDGDCGVFLGDEDGRKVIARLVPSGGRTAASWRERWEEAASAQHPNLIQTIAFGDAVLGRRSYSYQVIERPEDQLGDVVAERALSPDEAHAVISAILPALQYLHGRGLVHGDLDLSKVVAVGERVKLTTDSIQRIPEGEAAADLISAEIRNVGRLVREMMHVSTSEDLPQGLRAVELASTRANTSRWLAPAQLLGLLRGEQVLAPEPPPVAPPVTSPVAKPIVEQAVPDKIIAPPPPVPLPAPEPMVAEKPAAVQPVPPPAAAPRAPIHEPVPQRPPASQPRTPERLSDEPVRTPNRARTAVLAAALAFALLVTWALIRREDPAATQAVTDSAQSRARATVEPVNPPAPSPADPSKTTGSRVPAPSQRTRTEAERPSPVAAKVTPMPTERRAAAPVATRGGSGDWAVVAAIYRDFEAASRRASQLKKGWRGTEPSVFPPEGRGRKYMVVLASGLSRDEAERVQRDARSSGMPRDSYVTRLKF